ncbi:MAG: hypothetical protein JNM55_04140 [Anaerolineales bacterium]|nr:hypothetical protein [Anaerolineales bacterium]
MIAPLAFESPVSLNIQPVSLQSPGLTRMFAAAVVNRQFCEMLLNNPQEALQRGYLGETFSLTKDECELLVSIQARSLADLARQINRSLVTR